MDLHDRLRDARIKAGYQSATAAARAHRWKPQTYISHENGIRSPDRTIYDYAKAFNVSVEWLRTGSQAQAGNASKRSGATPLSVDPIQSGKRMPICATVGAGAFLPMDYDHLDEPIGFTVGPRSPRFPDARHIAFRVVGDSMNLARIMDGDIINCVEWADTGLVPVSGMIVVVEERKFGGQAYALTVKQIEVQRDAVLLSPRSSNPIHKPIALPKSVEDESVEVRIVALVYNINIPIPL